MAQGGQLRSGLNWDRCVSSEQEYTDLTSDCTLLFSELILQGQIMVAIDRIQ